MTITNQPPFTGQDWDDALEERADVAALVTTGIVEVQSWLANFADELFLDDSLIASLHRTVFHAVFPEFAGRFRGPSPTYVAYNVTFGNRRGTPYDEVPAAMEEIGRTSVNLIRQLDELRATMEPDEFRVEVLRAAAYVHCRFVEIHPFVNGNGRTSRLCINYFFRRYDIPLIAIPRPEIPGYIDAIRTWIDQRSVEHFTQFLLKLLEAE